MADTPCPDCSLLDPKVLKIITTVVACTLQEMGLLKAPTPKPKKEKTRPAGDFIGKEPAPGAQALPEDLERLFAAHGKEEIYPCIWMTEKEYEGLISEFGRDKVMQHVTSWSTFARSLDHYHKGNMPKWQWFRKSYRDHAQMVGNSCRRFA